VSGGTEAFARRTVRAGGHTVSYLEAGPDDGPVVVLLHGLASDSETWDRVMAPLGAAGLRVLAVDLIGHGRSDKPVRSYLLGDFADSLREILDALAVERATVAGHSLGGAIAIFFADRYPGYVERLVLVAAGGLGREVHPVLRAAALPIAPVVLGAATRPGLRRIYAHPRVHRLLRLTPDNVVNLRRAGRALGSAEGRRSFFAALRGVIEPAGQRGSFIELGTLTAHVPTLLVWNEHDPVIPVSHARAANAHLPGSRLVVFPGGGHEPHRRQAQRFVTAVAEFVRETAPADHR